ncbi:MAG: RsmB/NOP family class I SAM-dependent RNA methyltransferase [Treponema sp.]|nr:RsmB/NOP family class I SAM-dependent RNA methyltransferase [Treponema sp.]
MKNKNTPLRGKEGFEEYYKNLYSDRWNNLLETFPLKNNPVEYKVGDSQKSYFLDMASVYAALALPLDHAQNILDMCAAPGGKSIVIASRMEKEAFLSSNERSSDRKRRLDASINECLPLEISQRVKTSCSDAATWCKRQSEVFDCILLDAPCSSERHVYLDEKYLSQWSPSRIKSLAMEEWALLSSAYRLLAPGGYLLYSTCALASAENDGVIERLVKKFLKNGNEFLFKEPKFSFEEIKDFTKIEELKIEKTQFGYQILPDINNGAGPIYFSLIRKELSIIS